jgi:hypothetical protein
MGGHRQGHRQTELPTALTQWELKEHGFQRSQTSWDPIRCPHALVKLVHRVDFQLVRVATATLDSGCVSGSWAPHVAECNTTAPDRSSHAIMALVKRWSSLSSWSMTTSVETPLDARMAQRPSTGTASPGGMGSCPESAWSARERV